MRLLLSAIALILPFLIWGSLSYSGWIDSTFLPTPTATFQAGIRLFTEENLLLDIGSSSLRVAAGFLAAAAIGIPLGIAIGTFHSMESLFGPIVGTVRYMPLAAFTPLIVLWLGIDEMAKIVIILLAVVFYNATMIADAVKFIPSELLNVAYTLGGTRKDVLFRVILPATFPNILDALRVNIAGAWNFLVIAELIAAENGLGFRIIQAQRFLQTDEVFFTIFAIGLIGLATDFGFKCLFHVLTPWADRSRD